MMSVVLKRIGFLLGTAGLLAGCASSRSTVSRTGGNTTPSANGTYYQTSYTNPSAPLTPAPPAVVDYAQVSYAPDSAVAIGNATTVSAPGIYAESAIMIDAKSGRVLYSKNPDSQRSVASTQKLLTGLLIVERGGMSGKVTIEPQDTQVEPTKLGVKPGEQYARETLLSCMMVKSCNDAAAALARDHSGSTYAFAMAMNRKAYELGARSSNFHNPHGLPDPGQYSTARDMARIAFQAYRSPTLRRLMRTRFYRVALQSGRVRTLESTNKLLGRSSIFNGMKTGYTAAAGRCLVSSAQSGGREVILVQLGSKTSYIFDDAERLMLWGLGRRSLL